MTQAISSSAPTLAARIRELIVAGRLDEAERLLGRPQLKPERRMELTKALSKARKEARTESAPLASQIRDLIAERRFIKAEGLLRQPELSPKERQMLAVALLEAKTEKRPANGTDPHAGPNLANRIRDAIAAGRLNEAGELLQRPQLKPERREELTVALAQARAEKRSRNAGGQPTGQEMAARIRELISDERFEEAEALLPRPELRPETRQKLTITLAKARKDWAALEAVAGQQLQEEGATAELYCTLADARVKQNDFDGAVKLVEKALALDPEHLPAVRLGSQIAFEVADVQSALHYTSEAARLQPGDSRAALQRVRLLNTIGEIEASRADYDKIKALMPDDPLVRVFGFRYFAHDPSELRDVAVPAEGETKAAKRVRELVQEEIEKLRMVMQTALRVADLKRPVMTYHTNEEVAVARAPGSSTVMVVFAGLQDQMMGMPFPLFDRYLASLGVSAIFLKDFQRLFYLGGIGSLAPDYEGTVACLREMVADLGATRVMTVGASAGGAAAIRYGVELGAETAISLAGRSLAGNSLHEGLPDIWGDFMDRRLENAGHFQVADLRAFLQSRPYDTRIHILFGAGMNVDAAHARHLQDLANVSLHPLEGLDTHDVLEHIVQTDDFGAVLHRLTGLSPTPIAPLAVPA